RDADAEPGDELAQRRDLIARERLGRKQVEGARAGVLEQRVEDGDVVAEALPGRGGRGDDDVARGDGGQRLGLVGEQPDDAARGERGGEARIERGRHVGEARPAAGQLAYVDEVRGDAAIGAPAREDVGQHDAQPYARSVLLANSVVEDPVEVLSLPQAR